MSRFAALVLALAACGAREQRPPEAAPDAREVLDQRRAERRRVEPFASFDTQRPTGVAVTRDDRVFVSFPNWERQPDMAVARVFPGGAKIAAYPNAEWNAWDGTPGSVADHFVCVQSVWADQRGGLWILDSGAPGMERVLPGAPKLVHVDLSTDRVDATYFLDDATGPRSYLDDVRVDLNRNVAYLTDSGAGALVVLDLGTRRTRRVLTNHFSTSAEPDVVVKVDGREVLDSRTHNQPVRIHADGIALSRDGRYLYWHPLSGVTLYQIDTRILSDFERSLADIREAVEPVARTVVTDGIEVDRQGRILHTAIELDAIVAYDPATRQLVKIAQDEVLAWPDSLAVTNDDRIFVTVSRINEAPRFNAGTDRRTQPYGLFVIPPPAAVSAR